MTLFEVRQTEFGVPQPEFGLLLSLTCRQYWQPANQELP